MNPGIAECERPLRRRCLRRGVSARAVKRATTDASHAVVEITGVQVTGVQVTGVQVTGVQVTGAQVTGAQAAFARIAIVLATTVLVLATPFPWSERGAMGAQPAPDAVKPVERKANADPAANPPGKLNEPGPVAPPSNTPRPGVDGKESATIPLGPLAQKLIPPMGASVAELEAFRLVERLGDDRFTAREQASQELMKMGANAHRALLAGSRHLDREVRYRCERILILARQAELESRIRKFLDDAGSGQSYDFPSWDVFQKIYGDTRESRATFADMQRAEPDLLAKLALGQRAGLESLNTRCGELQQQLQAHSQEIGAGTVSALLFAAVEAKADTVQQTSSMIYNFCYQGAFRNSINSGANRDVLKRLLGQWIRRGRDFQAYQAIMLALQYDLKEGIEPARELISSPNMQAQMKQYAVLAIAKLGDRGHLPLVESLLNDDKSCGVRQMNNVNINTQLRDVALAALLHMTGQEFKPYGFDHISLNTLYVFDPLSTGFETAEKRNQALDKWKAYRAREKDAAAPKNG